MGWYIEDNLTCPKCKKGTLHEERRNDGGYTTHYCISCNFIGSKESYSGEYTFAAIDTEKKFDPEKDLGWSFKDYCNKYKIKNDEELWLSVIDQDLVERIMKQKRKQSSKRKTK